MKVEDKEVFAYRARIYGATSEYKSKGECRLLMELALDGYERAPFKLTDLESAALEEGRGDENPHLYPTARTALLVTALDRARRTLVESAVVSVHCGPDTTEETKKAIGEVAAAALHQLRQGDEEATNQRAQDERRYRRLRVIGCAPYGSEHLVTGAVLRFSNLDEFVDTDIAGHSDRGESIEDALHKDTDIAGHSDRGEAIEDALYKAYLQDAESVRSVELANASEHQMNNTQVRVRLDQAESILRSLASYVGSGGYNAPDPIDIEQFDKKIRDGIDHLIPSGQVMVKPLSDEEEWQVARVDIDTDVEGKRGVIGDLRNIIRKRFAKRTPTPKPLHRIAFEASLQVQGSYAVDSDEYWEHITHAVLAAADKPGAR